ncbi:MAG: hypothetical protein IPO25_20585 [Saprospiraceae bacterium]|nr:hypothetical protein [Saprospiraceae bacterium]
MQQGSSTYRPSIAGTYFAEARNTINGCKSSTRIPVSLVIRAVPTLSIITTYLLRRSLLRIASFLQQWHG